MKNIISFYIRHRFLVSKGRIRNVNMTHLKTSIAILSKAFDQMHFLKDLYEFL
jgi:hypothetical protein